MKDTITISNLGRCLLARSELLDAITAIRRAEKHMATALDQLSQLDNFPESTRNQLIMSHVALKSSMAIVGVIREQIPKTIDEQEQTK